MPSSTASSTSSHNAIKDALHAISKHAKEHHTSVQGAFEAYYGGGMKPTPNASATSSKRASIDSTHSDAPHHESTWSKVKKQLKEHHRSVNAAYGAYYGGITQYGGVTTFS